MDNPLLLYFIAFVFVIGLIAFSLWQESKKLVFKVSLDSRKKFNEFKPDDYLWALSLKEFEELSKLGTPESKKDRLVVKWSYSTPSGKTTYSDLKKYSLEQVNVFITELEPIFDEGVNRIKGLNSLYKERLSEGREVNDGLPKIYCYRILNSPEHEGLIKVGYAKNNAFKRIEAQFKTAARITIPHEILFIMPAVSITDNEFKDHSVHRILKEWNIPNPMGEWFETDVSEAIRAVEMVQLNKSW